MILSVPEHPDNNTAEVGSSGIVVVTHRSNNRIASPLGGNAYDLIGR